MDVLFLFVVWYCPEGYTELDGLCYLVPHAIATWDEAVAMCITQGGRLVEPMTLRQSQRVSDWALFRTDGRFWIGIYQNQHSRR